MGDTDMQKVDRLMLLVFLLLGMLIEPVVARFLGQAGGQTPPNIPIGVTTTVTPAMWGAGQTFDITTSGVTITLPPSSTVSTTGSIFVKTEQQIANLCPTSGSGDGILASNNGSGIANGCIPIPANVGSAIYYSGTPGATAYTANVGPALNMEVELPPTPNLTSIPYPMGGWAGPRVIYGLDCFPAQTTTGPATIAVWTAPNTVTAANVTTSGTLMSTTSCDVTNSAHQDLPLPGNPQPTLLPGMSQLWLVFTGSGWSSNNSTFNVHANYR